MKRYKEYAVVTGILFLVIAFIYYKFLGGEYMLSSGDSLSAQAVKHSLNNVEITGWYSYLFSGMPAVHSLISAQYLYPPHHIMLLLNKIIGLPWIWNFIFHYIFAGIGVYTLLRFLNQNKYSSIFGASLFMLLPSMIAYLAHGHGSQVMTACYIPWIILYLFKVYDKSRLIDVGIFSILIGLQILRGHPQIAYYTWMMIGLFILIKLIQLIYHAIKKNNVIELIKTKLFVLLSLVLGILSTLCLYLPVREFASLSSRGGGTNSGLNWAVDGWSLSWRESLTFILPYIHGFGGQNYYYNPYRGMNMTDFPNYIGLFIIILAIIGFWKSRIKLEYKVFFGLSIIFSFLISLGKYFLSFYEIFYNYFPYFSSFRVPAFILIVLQFSIIILASCGLVHLINILKRNIKYSLVVLLTSIIGITILVFNQDQQDHQITYESLSLDFQSGRSLGSIHVSDEINQIKIILDQYPELSKLYSSTLYKSDLIDFPNTVIFYTFFEILYNGYAPELVENLEKNLKNDTYYKTIQNKLFSTSNLVLEQYSPENIHLIIINHLKSPSVIEQNKSFEELNVETDSNIQIDYIFIIITIISLLILTLVLYRYNTFDSKYFILILMILCLYDYYRINSEIIDAKNHDSGKSLIISSDVFSTYLEEDEVINFLQKDTKPFRIIDETHSSNRFAAFGIENIAGYHAVKLSNYSNVLDVLDSKHDEVFEVDEIIDYSKSVLLNAKYIISLKPKNFGENKILTIYHQYLEEYIPVYINKNPNFRERVFFVKEITTNEFINANPDIAHIKNNHIKIDNFNYDKDAKVEIIDYKPGRIEFKTSCNFEQFLFISENHYPGWKLYNKENVEESIPLHKVNISFMGAFIPEGEKIFILEFKSNSLRNGMIISIIAALSIFSILVIGYRKEFYNRENL